MWISKFWLVSVHLILNLIVNILCIHGEWGRIWIQRNMNNYPRPGSSEWLGWLSDLFRGESWPPFGWSNGHLEEAGGESNKYQIKWLEHWPFIPFALALRKIPPIFPFFCGPLSVTVANEGVSESPYQTCNNHEWSWWSLLLGGGHDICKYTPVIARNNPYFTNIYMLWKSPKMFQQTLLGHACLALRIILWALPQKPPANLEYHAG